MRVHNELELRVEQRTAELVKANEALQAEITERKRAEEQIKASLQDKEVLLKEVHHRVKNNLQVISSLLYLRSKNIGDEQTLDDVSLGIDAAVPCGLILNELISNSLKHAFLDGREGEIRIELCSDDDNKFTLMARDNGVGLPKELDFRKAESLGLQLVNTLIDQLEGAIELDRSDGTGFEITFAERP
jgi:two-component sensor histidine kinase